MIPWITLKKRKSSKRKPTPKWKRCCLSSQMVNWVRPDQWAQSFRSVVTLTLGILVLTRSLSSVRPRGRRRGGPRDGAPSRIAQWIEIIIPMPTYYILAVAFAPEQVHLKPRGTFHLLSKFSLSRFYPSLDLPMLPPRSFVGATRSVLRSSQVSLS